MADLSPQAQAVLDAIQPLDWEASPLRDAAWERMAKQVAVATLKAAADDQQLIDAATETVLCFPNDQYPPNVV